MRNLTKTIAAVSLLMPVSAYPLGIGDIKLHSALNQKLDAEIALLVSKDEKASDITVRLASPDKFQEAGVPWSYFLSNIKFKAVTRADGSTVVKLTSKEALREPFLDFLIEVTWAKGNLYREFTVLVDPPVTYNKPTLPVIEKPQQIVTSRPVNTERRIVTTVDGEYGPTTRTDSIWKIAEKTNVYDDVSIEQMMMSIYETNPRAFYKKNVNALMAGKTLKIPEKDVILKLSKRQALAAFKEQDDIWQGRVTKKSVQTEQDNSQLATQLELEAPAADEISEAVDVLTGEEASPKQISVSEISDTKLATSDEGLALQARMDKLEQQLVMMQKILILKDEQIASLQNKKAVNQAERLPTKTEEVVEPGKVKIKKLAEVLAEKKAAEENAKIAKEKASQATVTEVKPVVPAEKKTVEKPKPKLKLKPVPEVEEETDFMPLVIAGGSVIILSILGLMWWRRRQEEEEVENESMFAAASEISLPGSGANSDDELSIPIAEDSSLYDVGTVGESSFLSEFTPSDFDAFDTDESEVDPISEADVYLAYGRYQQAEDLMVQAIKDFPERDECKLKLLEIYYTNENNSSFEKYAKELVAEGKPEDKKFWSKVVEMGRELDPDSSLYIDHATFESVDLEQDVQPEIAEKNTAEVVASDFETVDESPTDFEHASEEADFDLSVFDDAVTPSDETVEEKPVQEAEENTDDNTLDFDLSIFDVEDDKEVQEQKAEELETVDFSSSLEVTNDSGSEEIKIEQENDANIESFDFDFDDLGGENNQADKNDVEPEVIAVNEESDIDLESFDFSLDENAEVKEEISLESEVNVAEDKGIDDFDFDFDEPTIPTSTPVTELDAGVSDLTDMDELETKLDLAKAYIDMGDAEAAKDIAEEILEKGTPEQKVSAQEILDQLK